MRVSSGKNDSTLGGRELGKMNRSDLLLVGQTPPPYHGQSMMTGILFEHHWEELRVEKIRMHFSDEIESVGSVNLSKVWRLVKLIVSTWWVVLKCRPRVLYYLPASPNTTPVVRDVIYLGCVRWLFEKTIYHYHAGGLGTFLQGKGAFGKLAKIVYGKPSVAIDVNVTMPPSGQYFEAEQNVVVMNGLEVPIGEDVRKEVDVSEEFEILYVGLLCEEKGVMDLLRAAKLLREDLGKEFSVKLIGGWASEAFEQEVRKYIASEELEDVVTFTGVLHGEKKWAAYRDADLFVFPSHHPTETFGLVLLEAMANRLPIITTRWRGIPYVVNEGKSALLYDPHEIHQLRDALKLLVNSPVKREEIARQARVEYLEKYTKEKFIARIHAVFTGIVNQKKA